jgi:flagellar hook-associated protein 2
MSSIAPSTGLVSGLNIRAIIDAVTAFQQQQIDRTTDLVKLSTARKGAFDILSTQLLSLSSASQTLSQPASFAKYSTSVADPSQLAANATSSAAAGAYQFQVHRLADSQRSSSRGFVNTDQQTIGQSGTLSIGTGGWLDSDVPLAVLNGGAGTARGTIRITDRSGTFADVDLSTAASVGDVLRRINSAQNISVSARAEGDRIVILDTSGQTTTHLSITDRHGGSTAASLGIAGTGVGNTLAGASVLQVSSAFTLDRINDGLSPRLAAPGSASLRVQLTDVAASAFDVDLTGALTLGDVVNKINTATGNGGRLTAAIVNNRLQLTDNTAGGGPNPLSVTDINGARASRSLGLSVASSGAVLTGDRLAGGLTSPLLRNLNGGAGITAPGQVQLTDRAGRTSTIDLASASTLDDVLTAINSATDGGVPLSLNARLNSVGNGIEITDSSGSTTSNLMIADVGGGTTASDLRITVNAPRNSVNSGSLSLRYIGDQTSLDTLGPNGGAVRRGTFNIVDSTGAGHFVTLDSTAKNLGDVIDRINTATGGAVQARLNETGDGLLLVDQAAGTGQIQVTDVSGNTAADLRLSGTGTTGLDGKSRISARQTVTVSVAATDTLQGLSGKIAAANASVTPGMTNDGSPFAPHRLLLTSRATGSAGRFLLDDGGLGLGFRTQSAATDAVLQVGGSSGFLRTSSSNQFNNAVQGVNVVARAVGTSATTVQVSRDSTGIVNAVQQFVDSYNSFQDRLKELTKFDAEKQEQGALQGDSAVSQSAATLSSLVIGRRYGESNGVFRQLSDLGVSLGRDGKLTFDSSVLTQALNTNPAAVQDFFQNTTNGFASVVRRTVESFTDRTTGRFTLSQNALQSNIDSMERRIQELGRMLTVRKQTLLNQFVAMERALSAMQQQQQALGRLTAVVQSHISSSSSRSSSD